MRVVDGKQEINLEWPYIAGFFRYQQGYLCCSAIIVVGNLASHKTTLATTRISNLFCADDSFYMAEQKFITGKRIVTDSICFNNNANQLFVNQYSSS